MKDINLKKEISFLKYFFLGRLDQIALSNKIIWYKCMYFIRIFHNAEFKNKFFPL